MFAQEQLGRKRTDSSANDPAIIGFSMAHELPSS
jgi:hypothetical protein